MKFSSVIKDAFSTAENKKITANIKIAFFAQFVTFAVSILMSLLAPKILGVEDYAYWQLFLLYANYVGLTLFGVNDGLYLRLGGRTYSDIRKSDLRTQILIVSGVQIVFAIIIIFLIMASGASSDRLIVFCSVAIFLYFANMFSTVGYIFQAVNLTHLYSRACLINRCLFLILFLSVIGLNGISYKFFIFIYILCQFISLLFISVCARDIFKASRQVVDRRIMRQIIKDVKSGAKVMLGFYAGSLILGFARMVIDYKWGIELFGLFSFSFSIMAFGLSFINQAAMVLFPSFKRMKEDNQRNQYIGLRSILFISLPVLYILYFPICTLLEWWLPDYALSLKYLGLILPVCVFDSKMNLLCMTFLKVKREEGLIFKYNLIALATNIIFCLLAAFVLESISSVALVVVFAIVLRSFLGERHLANCYFSVPYLKTFLCEVLLAFLFIGVNLVSVPCSFVLLILALLLYWLVNCSLLKEAYNYIKAY